MVKKILDSTFNWSNNKNIKGHPFKNKNHSKPQRLPTV